MMKKLNNSITAIFLISILIISCKKNDETSKVVASTSEVISTNDTIIINTGIYFLSPNEKEIDSLKKVIGEDNFYTVADDSNFYISKIYSQPNQKITSVKFDKINFKNENYLFNKKSNKNNWLIIDYKVGSKPQIYSLVDFNLKLNEENSSTIPNTSNLDAYLNNTDFLSVSFDINGDGKEDKIFSNKPNTGDNLIVYFYENNGYVLKLNSTNLSQDGGNQVSEIKKIDNGFLIVTDFPQGTDKYTYFINYSNTNFMVNKVTHQVDSSEDNNKVKICEFQTQINLQKSVNEIFSELIDAEKKAVCVTKNN
ncbi:hypothetical protein [Flavobacterium sp.]|uniref:hypothetical protein n=1 Tax=Flavobacterium sp. TaxID=239 RepID=UPI00286E73E5|nr:hypothetical protein [Flavobacterium sp.]